MSDVVIVTGAEGLIGRHLRRHLAPKYALVSADVRPIAPLDIPDAREERFTVDFGIPSEIDAFWERLRPRHGALAGIVHLAWYYDFTNAPDPRYAALVEGLAHWLRRIGQDAPAHAPFLYSSSMAALKPSRPGERLTHQSPRLGGWAYPSSKIAAEEAIESARIPQPRVQLVLAAVYTDACELVPLYQTIERVRSRSIEKYLLPAPADRGLTYVHVDEVVRAFGLALERLRGRAGVHRFLIGQEHPVTYQTIHGRASLALRGRKLPIVRVPKFMALTGAHLLSWLARARDRRRFLQPWMIGYAGEHFEFDLTHTKEELGWEPARTLDQDLGPMLELARSDPDRWRSLNELRPW